MFIAHNPSGGALSGTKTLSADSGIATFSDLSIDSAGAGHTLSASGTGMITATSNAFDVLKQNTTTTLTADDPDPSVVGQAVEARYSVAGNLPGGGTPTGNVTVTASGGPESCTGTVGAGSCSIILTEAGNRALTANYAGDANFYGSTSADAGHTVNRAGTTTTITEDNPDPSVVGQAVTVRFNVIANSPGSGTPTGSVTVTVSGGSESCTGTVAAGSCSMTLTVTGHRTLTASYPGNANFYASTSSSVAHTVNEAPAITSINTSTLPWGLLVSSP